MVAAEVNPRSRSARRRQPVVTARPIAATRSRVYHAGVKPCSLAPWAHARATTSSAVDELHDTPQWIGCASAHRNTNP